MHSLQHDSLLGRLAESYAIPLALAVLSLHSESGPIVAQLCCLLTRLGLDASNQETIGRVGVSTILSALRSPTHAGDAEALQWACAALHNCCARNEANREAAKRAGAVPALLTVAARHRGTRAGENAAIAAKYMTRGA